MNSDYLQGADPARWDALRAQMHGMWQASGQSLADISESTGIARGHVHQFLTGKIAIPRLSFIYALGAHFGMTPRDIAAALGLDPGAPTGPRVYEDARMIALARALDALPTDTRESAIDIVYGAAMALVAGFRRSPG